MTKRFTTIAICAAAFSVFAPALAAADTISGRVTHFSPTSIAVFDKEVVTIGIDGNTAFTKLITQKPWQQDTALSFNALRVGAYVVVHVPDGRSVSNWVQVATDRPLVMEGPAAIVGPAPSITSVYMSEAAKHRAEAAARRRAPNASESKRPGSPDTALHCDRLADQLEKQAAGK